MFSPLSVSWSVCLSVCLYICLSAKLLKKLLTDFNEIFGGLGVIQGTKMVVVITIWIHKSFKRVFGKFFRGMSLAQETID